MIRVRLSFLKSPYTESYSPEIDGLRAIAVISVLFFHLGIHGFAGGFTGVDVFFVISGFLITRNIYIDFANGRWSAKRFYMRRARRLLPALIFTLALTTIFSLIVLWPPHLVKYAESVIYSAFAASNFLFMNESGYFDLANRYKPLLHTWSLGVEEQYYLIWPLALVTMLAFSRKLGLTLLVAVNVIALLFCEELVRSHKEVAFYMMPFRVPEFSLGIAAFFVSNWQLTSRWVRDAIMAIGMLCIAYAVTRYSENMLFPGITALLPCFGAALVILTAKGSRLGYLLRNSVAVRVGLLSYSLYLVHWPIIVLYSYHFHSIGDNFKLSVTESLGLAAASFLVAYFSYRYIETPFRQQRFEPSQLHLAGAPLIGTTPFLLICSICIAILVAGSSALVSGNGWSPTVGIDVPKVSIDDYTSKLYRCSIDANYFQICNMGASPPARGRLLVFGDSHAFVLSPFFDKLGKENDLNVTTATAGCPALFGVYAIWAQPNATPEWLAEGRENTRRCHEISMARLRMVHDPNVSIVAIANRWEFYDRGDHGILLVQRLDDKPSVGDQRRIFETAMMDTIRQLHGLGKKVVLVSQAPLLTIEPRECMRFNCRNPFGAIDNASRYVEGVINRTARLYPGAVYPLILPDLLCEQNDLNQCYIVRNGKMLYADDDHLSLYGANLVFDDVHLRLQKFVGPERESP